MTEGYTGRGMTQIDGEDMGRKQDLKEESVIIVNMAFQNSNSPLRRVASLQVIASERTGTVT